MTTTTPQLDARRTGAWRHEVLDRAGRLEQELHEYDSPESADEVTTARRNIKAAEGIAGDPTWRPQGWSGRSTENAWRHLRLAEEALTHLAAEHPLRRHELTTMTARVLSLAPSYLPVDDAALKELRTLHDTTGKDGTQWSRYAELAGDVTVRYHEAATTAHHQQRSFRNQLRGLTLVLLALAAGGVLALALVGPPAESLVAAPEGLQPWVAAAVAMGMGSVGALFSAVPSLAAKPTEATPFNTLKEQAALKVVVGAWSAVVGLVVVTAGLTSPGSDVSEVTALVATEGVSLAGFALMAAYFGATQEALTRFADRKASAVDPSTP